MKQTVSKLKKGLRGEFPIPGDKSISHRSVIFGSLAEGTSEIDNFLNGEDCIHTRDAFAALGVEIENNSETSLKIHGKGLKNLSAPNQEIYLGNSGTGMRLLAGLFSGLAFDTVLSGDESLSARPMARVIDPLSLMGAKIESNGGKAPLKIIGGQKLQGINYKSPIASAQVKSCLLLAGLSADTKTKISEDHKSRDHSERMFETFGAAISYPDELSVELDPLNSQKLRAQKFTVPSDISSAAFLIVAAAICPDSEVLLPGIGLNPTRTGIIDVMDAMGVDYSISNKQMQGKEPVGDLLIKYSELQGCTIEGALIPRLIDEIPVLAVMAAHANGQTIIKDAAELKVKESNRIDSTVNLLKAIGVSVTATDDGMIIEGNASKEFATDIKEEILIDSKGDHRIAMSAAVAALNSAKEINILGAEFVNTSFPGFFDLLK